MPHLDPEELSLLALYDHADKAGSREHLRICPECAAEFAALRRTVDAVRTVPDGGRLETPGPHVWAGIHRELGLSESLQEDPLAGAQEQAPAAGKPQADGEAQAEDDAAVQPVPLHGRTRTRPASRQARAWWQRPGAWMAAAAAALLVAAGAVWSLNRAPQQLAEADLAPLPQYSAAGSARVVEAGDGSRSLEVRLSKDEAQGYQEVWLIAPDLSRLVSLGIMNSETGTFELPAGLELAEYPIVDVSDEPIDGNPAHSSVSIARGTLNT